MIYELVEYGLLFGLCTYLVMYYSGKQVSMHVKVWSVITWVLNFGLALLVPEDVYQTLMGQKDHQINYNMGVQYLLLYWSVYLLTWTIIPVLQEWEDAGDLESGDRMRRSLKSNGIFYLVLIIGAVVFLLILIFLDAGGQMGLITFLKCLATMWGMLLLMILMGYSLVEIPKTMWRNADAQDYLVYLYHRVVEMEVQVDESKTEFKNIVTYINYVKKNSKDQNILRYCKASEDMIPEQLKITIKSNYQNALKMTGYLDEYPISLQNSIQHNRLIKRAIARCRRQQKAQSDYVRQAIFYEDVQQAIQKNIPLKSMVKKIKNWQQAWYCRIRRPFNKICSVLIGICSIIILISQTQVFLTKKSSILSYLLMFQNLQVIRVLVFVVIAFIVYMANYALFRLKLANLYGLYPRESDGASMMFATVNFSRIGVAIVLNFFDMIKMENSLYARVMQAPSMGLLGEWVIKGLPGVLWLIVLCHYFNVWGWIANKLGFEDSFSFSSHQMTANRDNKITPLRVQQKRQQLQRNYSTAILQFQELDQL